VAKTINVERLTASFGSHTAVSGVTLPIEGGKVTAIIGPSGCGKSTLIRCINRLHEVVPGARVEGRVTLDGEDLYESGVDAAAVRRNIGMVFQRPNPFPTMSVYDNVAAGFRLAGGRKRKDLDSIVERSLRGAGLWDEVKNRLKAAASGLSGGQQQRLCIARAIAVEPEVLLMDEPASALDPASTLRIEDLVRQLKDRYTIAIVTHNMQQAARVSDYTAFMTVREEGQPGELVELGPTEKIFTKPDQKLTEDYVTGRFG
jgi:phosphate transport system ATP-binding protein